MLLFQAGAFLPLPVVAGELPAFDQLSHFTGPLGLLGDRESFAAMDRDGDLLAIGLPLFDNELEQVGMVLIYRWLDGEWHLEEKFVGAEERGWFGATLAVHEGEVIIGAPGYLSSDEHDGTLFFYQRDETGWHLEREIRGSDTECFGFTMAQRGDWLLVGDPCAGDGNVRVYERQHVWVAQPRLTGEGGGLMNNNFGRALAIADDNLFIWGNGKIFRYARTVDDWELAQTLPGYEWLGGLAATGDTLMARSSGDQAILLQEVDGAWVPTYTIPGQAYRSYQLSDDFLAFETLGTVNLFRREELGAVLETTVESNEALSADWFSLEVHATGLVPDASFPDQWIFNDTVFRSDGGDWQADSRFAVRGTGSRRNFGGSVAFDGNSALVTAPGRFVDAPGAALFYERIGGSWRQTAEIRHGEVDFGDCEGFDNGRFFGISASLSGDTALIGTNQDFLSNAGTVLVFQRTKTGWQHTQTFCDLNNLGASLAIDGDHAVSVHEFVLTAFRRVDGVWEQQQQILDFEFFSRGVIDGDRLLARLTGNIAVYEFDGMEWIRVDELELPPGVQFTRSLGLAGDLAAVGHPNDNGEQGAVYTFVRDSEGWQLGPQLTISGGPPQHRFGWDLALDGNRLAVSASDGVRLYAWDGAAWNLERELNTLPSPGTYEGHRWTGTGSLALQGDNLLVGTPQLNIPGFQGGGVFFFGTFEGTFRDGFESGDLSAWKTEVN